MAWTPNAFVGDLRDMTSLDRAMKGVRRVFHVAADYRLWTQNPNEIYETNVEGTRRLLEVAAPGGRGALRLHQHRRDDRSTRTILRRFPTKKRTQPLAK